MDGDFGSDQVWLVRRSARIVLTIFVVVALLFFALFWLERGGASPGRPFNVANHRTTTTTIGGTTTTTVGTTTTTVGTTTTTVGTTTTTVGTTTTTVGTTTTTILTSGGLPPISQITVSDQTCQQFSSGTAATSPPVMYSTKHNATINNSNPGIVDYWVTVPVTSAGPQTFTITQATTYAPTTGSPLFTEMNASFASDSNCNQLSTTVTGGTSSDPNVVVSFTAAAAGNYFILVKFNTMNIIGSSPADTTSGFSYTYTFSTTGVSGSTQNLLLTHT